MEALTTAGPRRAGLIRDLLLLGAFTVLLHLPFVTQPVAGDEGTYLDIAHHALSRPLTPLNFQYVFQGRMVDAAGHPHPPLDAYLLALAWVLRGHFSVLFFHAFYLLFAVGAAFAAYALAARFTARPLWCALLVAASPVVQVTSNTLGLPDSPALAFLLAGAAAFLWRRFGLAAIALMLAGLTELQALALPPILLLDYLLRRERPPRAAWFALGSPYLGLAAWQGLQWSLTNRLPAAVLLGYMQSASNSRAVLKLASAAALVGHLGVLVTPAPFRRRRAWAMVPGLLAAILAGGYPWWERAMLAAAVALGCNALLWLWESRRRSGMLAAWCLLYFAFAALAFFAGGARYLMPLALPMALLFVIQFQERPVWLALALAVNLVLGLGLSVAGYEFSRAYAHLEPPPGRPFLVNGDWGFRFYMLARGGEVLHTASVPRPGEWIVASDLSLGGNFDSMAEEAAVPLRTSDIRIGTPLRLIDRYAHSGFLAVSFGLLPFSFSSRPLDRITYSVTSPYVNMPAPWTPTRISGHLVYLPDPGQGITIPLRAAGTLRFALFASGQGQVSFSIRQPSGNAMFERTVPVNGELWQPATLPLAGVSQAVLSVTAPSGVRAGWGELICDPGPSTATSGPAVPQAPLMALSCLRMADIRSRPQLISGWYTIEDGNWRWMAKDAEVALRPPADAPLTFEMQLYFPGDYMRNAGGPVTVSLAAGDAPLAEATYTEPGGYLLSKPVPRNRLSFPLTRLSIHLNRALPPAGADLRELGVVVQRLGFLTGAR